jgi:NDP-sugar pyrophosphorylase family protein
MTDSIAGLVLAAGAGERLRPLTRLRPKPMCPVGDRPLVDHVLDRFVGVTDTIAVNIHHGRALLESHLAGRVHLSVEDPEPLGTAGAIGNLRDWIAGRPTLLANGDTWCPSSMQLLLDGWDGERSRLLIHGDTELTPRARVAGALVPWSVAEQLKAEPSGLYEAAWRADAAGGSHEVVTLPADEHCVDCGTPADYLRANLTWSGGESVVGAGAIVEGSIDQCVVWPGALVRSTERLHRAIRAHEHMTVIVR